MSIAGSLGAALSYISAEIVEKRQQALASHGHENTAYVYGVLTAYEYMLSHLSQLVENPVIRDVFLHQARGITAFDVIDRIRAVFFEEYENTDFMTRNFLAANNHATKQGLPDLDQDSFISGLLDTMRGLPNYAKNIDIAVSNKRAAQNADQSGGSNVLPFRRPNP